MKIVHYILNTMIAFGVLYYLYIGYFILFDRPTDSLALAKLTINNGYSGLFLLTVSIIKINLKNRAKKNVTEEKKEEEKINDKKNNI